MHFGLEPYIPIVLYLSFWVAILLSIFWRPIAGIYYVVPIIPAQTFRDQLASYPLGASVVTIVLIAVAIGLLNRRQTVIPRIFLRSPLCLYAGFTFVSLCYGSMYLGHSLPISFTDPRIGDWRNYITMLFLVFLVSAAVATAKEMKILIMLMCVSVLLFDRNFWSTVSDRDYSSYSEDLRTDAGAVGYAGLNGLAAFEAQISMALMALAAFERNRLRWLTYVGLALFSSLCLMYSLSRGGYVAFLAGWLFLGLVKYRRLLVLLIVFGLTWTTVVPNAVVERVFMTTDSPSGELDHSSEMRVTLWEDALEIFKSHPVIGTGFDTYAYLGRVDNYRDTHNIYLKVLVETGVVGLLLFLWLVWRTFRSGFGLFRRARDPFLASLGLALAVWVVTTVAANCFGDRWTYLQVNGYMWVLGGLGARGWLIEQESEASSQDIEAELLGQAVQTTVLPAQA